MAIPLVAGLPPDLVLGPGYSLRLRALDPTFGTNVAGVRLTDVSYFVRNVGEGSDDDLQVGPFLLVPGPGAQA